jgi:hypothetical protein
MNIKSYGLIASLLAGVCCWWCNDCRADPVTYQANKEATVESVIEQWEQRKGAVKTVKFVLEGERTVLGGRDNGEDRTNEMSKTWWIDLSNGWFRREIFDYAYYEEGDELTPRHEIIVYDGDVFRLYLPPVDNPLPSDKPGARRFSLSDYGGEVKSSVAVMLEDLPILFALGLMKWSDKGFLETLNMKIDPQHYSVEDSIGSGGELLLLSTRPSLSATGDRPLIIEYLADPHKNGAILTYRRSVAPGAIVFGAEAITIETSFKETEFGWFPESWKVHIGEADSLQESTTYRVTDLAFNEIYHPSLFRIEDEDVLEPGMLVAREGKPYTVGKDGTTLNRGVSRPDGGPDAKHLSFWKLLLIVGNILVLSIVILYYLILKRGRS